VPTKRLRPADQRDRTRDFYTIRGYISTAVKHGRNAIADLREAMLGRTWLPELPAPT